MVENTTWSSSWEYVPGIGNPSPLRGEEGERRPSVHGFRSARRGPPSASFASDAAPPVATNHGPVGAESGAPINLSMRAPTVQGNGRWHGGLVVGATGRRSRATSLLQLQVWQLRRKRLTDTFYNRPDEFRSSRSGSWIHPLLVIHFSRMRRDCF